MTEEEAIDKLTRSGIGSLIKWAAPVAFTRTAQDYDDDAGHDQSIIGGHNFVYIRNLLDRGSGNGRYAQGPDTTGDGDDYLSRGIPPEAFLSMPSIPPGLIARSDYQQSPGWASGDLRVLLQSYKLGNIDKIRWVRPAKRKVATQRFAADIPLFEDEDFGLQSLPGIPDDDNFEGTTLVIAHASNPLSGQFELFVGLSKNPLYRGDSCWHWRQRLLSGGAPTTGLTAPTSRDMPGNAPTGEAEEIPVRLRQPRKRGTVDDSNE